jgi:hypothetical protein
VQSRLDLATDLVDPDPAVAVEQPGRAPMSQGQPKSSPKSE